MGWLYLRVGEAFLGGSVGADDTIEVGAGSVGGERVADSAEGLEDLLSLASITCDLLLGGHIRNLGCYKIKLFNLYGL